MNIYIYIYRYIKFSRIVIYLVSDRASSEVMFATHNVQMQS